MSLSFHGGSVYKRGTMGTRARVLYARRSAAFEMATWSVDGYEEARAADVVSAAERRRTVPEGEER